MKRYWIWLLLAGMLPHAAFSQSMFRGDAAHTGVYKTEGPKRLNGVKWTFKTEGWILASPVSAQGLIFCGSDDKRMYAVDQASGQLKWKFETGAAIRSTPAVSDGVLFFGSYDGFFYALEAGTGKLKWKFEALMASVPEMDAELSRAMHEVMLDPWSAYEDSVPTLRELKRRGIKLALVSSVGIDIRQVIERSGMRECFDAMVLSHEAGSVKPESSIFQRALDALGVPARHALMVGDDPADDAGAALLGIRTLLLPRTKGDIHGLEIILRMVGP